MANKKTRRPNQNKKTGKKIAVSRVLWPGYLLAALLFFQPLILQRLTADQFDMGKLVFLYGVVAVLLLAGVIAWRERNLLFGLDSLNTAVFAFLAFSLVSTTLSIHFPTSFFGRYQRYEGWLTFFCLIVLFQFARNRDLREKRWAEVAIAASVALVSLYGVLQRFNLDPLSWSKEAEMYGIRVFSTIGNPVMLGGFLVLSLPICLSFITRENRFERLWGILVWILGAICLYFTESQGAWFGLWIGALALVFFLGCRPKTRFKWIRWVSVSLFMLTCLFVVSLYFNRSPILFSSSGQVRMEFYRVSIKMFQARPLFGWGPDTLKMAFRQFESLSYVQNWGGRTFSPSKAHNLFLEVLSTQGILAFLSFMLITGLVVVYGYRRLKQDEEGLMNPFILSGVIGYLAYLMTGLTEISVSPTWWVLMGFLAGKPLGSKTWKQISFSRTFLTIGMIPMVFVLVTSAFSQAVADRSYLYAEGTADLFAADILYLRAERFNPYNHMYFIDHGFRWVERGIEFNDFASWQKGIGILKRAVKSNPREVETYVNLGIAYNRGAKQFGADYYREGIPSLEQAVEISPLMLDAHHQLSVAFLSLGRYQEALKESKETLRIDPGYIPAHILRAGALFNLGRTGEARQVLLEAKALSPQNRQVQDNLKFLDEQGGN